MSTLYPQRQRCLKCRKKLGDEVFFRQYCSSVCAGIPTPSTNPEEAPRECVTQRDGTWQFKRRYRCEEEVPTRLREEIAGSLYECQHCGHLHVGHTRMQATETHSVLFNPEDLGERLVKLRGKATRKQVAEVLGVRPIRIKEWEEGQKAEIDVLFALLRLYKVKPALVFEGGRR